MKDKALSEGFIKIFRKIQDDDRIYKDSVTVHLVLHCILKASHKRREIPFNQQTITIKRGEFITGIRQISRETGIPPKKIRSRLAFLGNIGFLAHRKGTHFSIISVCNYDYYQSLGNKTAHPESTLGAHQGHEYKNGKIRHLLPRGQGAHPGIRQQGP